MLINNFEQRFVNCVLNLQNVKKSAQNQINSLNTSKNELMVKNKNPETPETDRKLSKSIKHRVLTVYRC